VFPSRWQWRSGAIPTGASPPPPSVGLVVGQLVASPRRPSFSVDDGRLPWSGDASAAIRGKSVVAVAEGRSPRLPQSRTDEPLVWGSWAAPSWWRCVVLASSPRGGPHGGGDGEPWADGVAHPRVCSVWLAWWRGLLDDVAGCSSAGSSFGWRLMPAPKL
jgi:hypothetical protein